MYQRFRVTLVLLLLTALLAVTGLAQAQTPDGVPRGSIRGTIRLDPDGDGRCGSGAAVVGIPIEFVSNDKQTVVYLQTGDDGTYGLVAAGLGTWQVSAKPGADYVVTSAKTRPAFIDEASPLILGIDFCVRKTSGTTLLPQSGGAIAASTASMLLAAFGAGASLLAGGAAIEWRRRRG